MSDVQHPYVENPCKKSVAYTIGIDSYSIIMGHALSKERFSEAEQPTKNLRRPPLCCGGGVQALAWAERLDGYEAAVAESPVNVMARQGQLYQPAGLYPAAVDPTGFEYKEVVLTGKEVVPLEEPSSPWPNGQVIFMNPSADGGLPHTRPPFYICIPAGMDLSEPTGRQTLTHERIHVSQRLHEEAWTAAYEKAWNWKVVSKPTLPKPYAGRVRINPDTHNAPTYAWQGEWVPVPIFESAFSPDLKNARLVWWHIPSKNIYTSSPPGFDAFYGVGGTTTVAEGPHELAAYMLSSAANQSPARRALEPLVKGISKEEVY